MIIVLMALKYHLFRKHLITVPRSQLQSLQRPWIVSTHMSHSFGKQTEETDEIPPKIQRTITGIFTFLEKLLHMDEVIRAQSKVRIIQNDLKESGDTKRQILMDMNLIRDQLNRCHGEIFHTQRGDTRLLELIEKENKLLKEEQMKQLDYSKADERERFNFNALTIAINESYEREKIYSNSLKNLGIIGTLAGLIISFLGSSIGFYLHYKKSDWILSNLAGNVNNTIRNEIKTLNTDMRKTASQLEAQHKRILEFLKPTERKAEGWGSYLKRHATTVGKWVIYPFKS